MDSTTSGWYYSKRGDPTGQQVGPLSFEQLYSLVQVGTLTPTDVVWNQTHPGWLPAAQVSGLFPAAATPAVQAPYPAPEQAAVAYGQATQPVAARSTETGSLTRQFKFEGKGGSLFSLILGRGLLILITAGIYGPWAWCRLQRFFLENLSLDGKKFGFQGKGGRLFALLLGQGLLTMITGGIYGAWAIVKITKYLYSKTNYDAKAFEFNGKGGEVFLLLLGQGLLTIITAGIYGPWAYCRIMRYMDEHSMFDGKAFGFTGQGGECFVLLLVQGLLTAITFYIYGPWALVKLMKFVINNTTYGDAEAFKFEGKGGELFWIMLKGILLCFITIGVYYSWYLIKLFKWEAGSTTLEQKAGSAKAGWYADHTGRHQLRYWDGLAWTDNVADDGRQSMDPLSQAPPS